MSNQNLELIKGMMSGFDGADSNAIREMLPALIPELCTTDIEFVETPERVDAQTFHGHEGVLEAFNRWLDQWDEYNAEAESFEDHGDEVFVVAREHGRGRSGATAEARLYQIYTFREDKICRYREFYLPLPGVLRRGSRSRRTRGLAEAVRHHGAEPPVAGDRGVVAVGGQAALH